MNVSLSTIAKRTWKARDKLGIQGIRMKSPEQVIAELGRLGVTADPAA